MEVFSYTNSHILFVVMVWAAEPRLSFPGGLEQKFLVFGTSLLLLSHFSRVRLCDPRDGSPPGSAVPGVLQVRIIFSIINLNKSHRFLFLFFFFKGRSK